MLKKYLLTSVCFILYVIQFTAQNGSIPNPNLAGFSQKGLDRYDHYLQEEIDAARLPGAVSLIYRRGQVAHSQSYGYNNMTTNSPMTKDKIFYIQSMTKPIISVAFMMLYEEGHFFLTDPVSKYIPAFEDLKVIEVKEAEEGEEPVIDYVPLNEPVRIWHLLSHTAGFSHGLGQNKYDKNLYHLLYETEYATIQDRVGALLTYPLMGQPGEQWNYSAAPDVISVLIEKFSGQTTAAFLKERIFDPLDMDDTGYNLSDSNLSRLAGLHQPGEDRQLGYVDPWGPVQGNTVYGGTHGLFSTAKDYMKFGLMLLNNGVYHGHRIIGRKTLELMTENHIEGLAYPSGSGFGLGFGITTDVSDSKLSGSEGAFYWSGAFNTYFFVDQEEDLVAVLMTQHFPYMNLYAKKLAQFIYSAIDD